MIFRENPSLESFVFCMMLHNSVFFSFKVKLQWVSKLKKFLFMLMASVNSNIYLGDEILLRVRLWPGDRFIVVYSLKGLPAHDAVFNFFKDKGWIFKVNKPNFHTLFFFVKKFTQSEKKSSILRQKSEHQSITVSKSSLQW